MKKILVLLPLACLAFQNIAMDQSHRMAMEKARGRAAPVCYDKAPDRLMLTGDPRLEPSAEFTGGFFVKGDLNTQALAVVLSTALLFAPAYALTQGRRPERFDHEPLQPSCALEPFGRIANATAPFFDDDGSCCRATSFDYRQVCDAKRATCGFVGAPKKLTFVTQNSHKLDDAQRLLPEFKIEHVDFEVQEIQSLDPREIIEHKLKFAFEKIQKPCFVMDASLFFDCLNDFPGPLIKWWFEKTVGAEKTCQIAKLFGKYGCRWTTTLGYFDGNRTYFFEETIRGTVPEEPRGTNGYHWDTIFVPEGETRTFAQMTFEEKQSYAVTKKLLRRLRKVAK